jgi:hypothetical protein
VALPGAIQRTLEELAVAYVRWEIDAKEKGGAKTGTGSRPARVHESWIQKARERVKAEDKKVPVFALSKVADKLLKLQKWEQRLEDKQQKLQQEQKAFDKKQQQH